MATTHVHDIRDNDPHFKIDPATRAIINTSGKVVLIQYDHNSERFTFEIPLMVDNHDMSKCDKVEVHYMNGNTRTRNSGVYVVGDLDAVDTDTDNPRAVCSWLVSSNATQLVGPLNFMVRFMCLDGDVVTYSWNTGIHTGISVSAGMDNSEYIVEEYVDVLEQWKLDLAAAGITMTSIEQTVTSTEDEGLNEVTMSFSDGHSDTFYVRNGSKGSPGTPGASIESITRTSGTGAPGTTDTYTVTLTDGNTSTFQVYNGSDGDGAGDMTMTVYDPQGRAEDIFGSIDTVGNNLYEHIDNSEIHLTEDYKTRLTNVENSIGDINSILDTINGEVI